LCGSCDLSDHYRSSSQNATPLDDKEEILHRDVTVDRTNDVIPVTCTNTDIEDSTIVTDYCNSVSYRTSSVVDPSTVSADSSTESTAPV